MVRIALSLFALALAYAPAARADLAYAFDITTAFAASDPFPNLINTGVYAGDTGYLQVVNNGPGAYGGLVRIVASSGYDGDLTFTLPNVYLPAGGSFSIGMPVDSSIAGGFNNFTGDPTPSVPGTFRPGVILYMEGAVDDGTNGGAIKIAMQDLDANTGVVLTDPNGFETDAFVLQGGDPFGLYNGDAWELANLPEGHDVISGIALAPEPKPWTWFAAMLPLLVWARPAALARRRHSRHTRG